MADENEVKDEVAEVSFGFGFFFLLVILYIIFDGVTASEAN